VRKCLCPIPGAAPTIRNLSQDAEGCSQTACCSTCAEGSGEKFMLTLPDPGLRQKRVRMSQPILHEELRRHQELGSLCVTEGRNLGNSLVKYKMRQVNHICRKTQSQPNVWVLVSADPSW